MAARTAGLAAEGGVEAVVGEAVSVRKAASGRVRRAAHRPRRANLEMPSVPRAKSTRSRTAMDVLLAEAASHHERAERPERESEPTYAVPVTERPVAPPEIKVESDSKEESAPPRRGWWQR